MSRCTSRWHNVACRSSRSICVALTRRRSQRPSNLGEHVSQRLHEGFGQRRQDHSTSHRNQQFVLKVAPKARQHPAHRGLAQIEVDPCLGDIAFPQQCVERDEQIQIKKVQIHGERILPRCRHVDEGPSRHPTQRGMIGYGLLEHPPSNERMLVRQPFCARAVPSRDGIDDGVVNPRVFVTCENGVATEGWCGSGLECYAENATQHVCQ